jgi:hypothetical protein
MGRAVRPRAIQSHAEPVGLPLYEAVARPLEMEENPCPISV